MLVQGSQTRNALAGLIQKPPEGVADLVDEMDKDYQVKLSDLTLTSGIKQVKVSFKCDDKDERAKAVKDAAESLYYKKLSAMVQFLKYGRVAFERAWKYAADKNVNTVELNELPFRNTKMILLGGQFDGIELKGKDDQKQPVTVTLKKPYAWWLSLDGTPTEPHGRSRYIGAPCDMWHERKNTRRLLRIFLDKFALGSRIIYAPLTVDDPNNTDPNAAKMAMAQLIVQQFQAYEAGGSVVIDNARQIVNSGTGQQDVGYVIEVKEDNAKPQESAPILAVIAEQDSWQLLSFGIPPKTVTEGSEVGSFAMVAQQRIVLLSVFEEAFLQLREQFQSGVIDPMVEMNGCSAVTMDYTPLTERPDDLASEVVKAWLTTPKLAELVASGTVDMIAMLEACGVPVTQEGHQRLTKLITRLSNPPAQPTNPDGTIKTPEQLKAEYAVKTGEDPDDEPAKPGANPPPKPPIGLSSPFLASLWPSNDTAA